MIHSIQLYYRDLSYKIFFIKNSVLFRKIEKYLVFYPLAVLHITVGKLIDYNT